jgi:hypothetical protein
LTVVVVIIKAEYEVGWSPSRERRENLSRQVVVRVEDELDLLARLLLEGGDHLRDRFVLPGIEALLAPHDEVSGLCTERRHDDRRGENYGFTAQNASLRSTANYVLAPGARQGCARRVIRRIP